MVADERQGITLRMYEWQSSAASVQAEIEIPLETISLQQPLATKDDGYEAVLTVFAFMGGGEWRIGVESETLASVPVNGRFMNKDAHYGSGILFDVTMDAFYNITYIINILKRFFEELKRIQGHSNFY